MSSSRWLTSKQVLLLLCGTFCIGRADLLATDITWTAGGGPGSIVWSDTNNWNPAQTPGDGDNIFFPEITSETLLSEADYFDTFHYFGTLTFTGTSTNYSISTSLFPIGFDNIFQNASVDNVISGNVSVPLSSGTLSIQALTNQLSLTGQAGGFGGNDNIALLAGDGKIFFTFPQFTGNWDIQSGAIAESSRAITVFSGKTITLNGSLNITASDTSFFRNFQGSGTLSIASGATATCIYSTSATFSGNVVQGNLDIQGSGPTLTINGTNTTNGNILCEDILDVLINGPVPNNFPNAVINNNQFGGIYYDTTDTDKTISTIIGDAFFARFLTKQGDGTLTIVDGSGYNAKVNVNAPGGLTLQGNYGGFGGIQLAQGAQLLLDGSFTCSAPITDNPMGSETTVLVESSGTVVLGGGQSYTGVTAINSGTLSLTGGTSSQSITNKGVLQLDTSGGDITFNTPITDTGSVSFTGTGGTLFLPGMLSYLGDTNINDGNVDITGSFTGTASITLNGSSFFNIEGDITSVSGLTVNAGAVAATATLSLLPASVFVDSGGIFQLDVFSDTTLNSIPFAGTGILQVGGSATATVDSSFPTPGTLSVVGNATLNVTGAGDVSTAAGVSAYNAGILKVDSLSQLPATANVFVYNGGFLDLAVPTNQTLALTGDPFNTSMSGGGLISSGPGTLSIQGALLFDGTLRIDGGLVTVGSSGSLTGGVNVNSASSVFDIANATSPVTIGDLSGVIGSTITLGSKQLNFGTDSVDPFTFNGVISGSGTIVKQGTGDAYLTATNTFTGAPATISGGSLYIAYDGSLGPAGTLNIGADVTLGTTQSVSTSRPITIGSGNTLTLFPSGNLTCSGNISGAGNLTIGGSGSTVTLTATNSYLGQTTLFNGSSVTISRDACFGTTNATLNVNNSGHITLSATISSMTRPIALTSQLFIDTNGFSLNYSGTISGSGFGQLIKQGTGTLTLVGTNTYQNGTQIVGGVLNISQDSSLGTAGTSISFNNNTTLQLGGSFSTTRAMSASGFATNTIDTNGFALTSSGNLNGPNTSIIVKKGLGTLTLTGTSTLKGTTLSGGVLNINKDACLGTTGGTLTVNDDSSLQLAATIASMTRPVLISSGKTSSFDTNSFSLTLSGVVSGAGSLAKNGTGTLTLSGTNSYTGGTTINGGTLSVSSATRIGGATGSLTLNGGALVTTGALTTSGSVSVTSNSTINGSSGTVTLSGTMTGAAGTTLASSGTLSLAGLSVPSGTFTLSGIISGTQTVTKGGGGVLLLSGTNTYSNPTTLTAGTIALSNNTGLGTGTLSMSDTTILSLGSSISAANPLTLSGTNDVAVSSGTGTLSGTISNTGVLRKTGSGTLVLSGTNSYSGGTLLNAGTLSVAAAANLGNSSATLTLNGGTLATTSTVTLSTPVVVSETSTVNASGGNAVFQGTLTGANAKSLSNSGSLSVSTIAVASSDTFTMPGDLSGSQALTKTGTGTLILSGTNTYTNGSGTTIAGGTLQVGADTNLGNSSNPIAFQGGGVLNTTTGITSSRAVTMTGNGAVNVDSGTTALSGAVTGSGALSKTGNGILSLGNGSSNYAGGTNLNAGQITLTNSSGLGSGTLAMAGSTTLLLNNTVNAGNAIHINDSATATVVVGTGDSSTLSGATASTSGTLAKSGNGTLVLGGSNQHSGGTNLNAGQITLSDSSGLGSGQLLMATGTTLALNNAINASNTIHINDSATVTVIVDTGNSGTLSGATASTTGAIAKSGNGILVLGGSNQHSGGTNLSAGQITLGNSSGLGSGTLTMASGTALGLNNGINAGNTIHINDSATATVTVGTGNSGTLSGATASTTGTLAKSGNGILVLGGSNQHSGGTNLSAGQITLGNNSGLGSGQLAMTSGTTLALNNGITANNQISIDGTSTFQVASGTATLSNQISNTGALAKTSSGTLILSGTNIYSGGTTIAGGTLQVGADTNLGNSSGSVVFQGGGILNTTTGITSSRAVTMTGNGAVNVDSGTTTLSGAVTGSGALSKTGNGILSLGNGSSNYAGGTNLNAGQITLTNSSGLGSGTLTMAGETTLVLNNTVNTSNAIHINDSATATVIVGTGNSGTLSGATASTSGTLAKSGNGTLVLGGGNQHSGGTNLNAGQITLSDSSGLGSGQLSMASGTTLALNNGINASNQISIDGTSTFQVASGNATLSDQISNIGTLAKTGNGTLILTGANNYSGGTTIASGGTLVGNDQAFGTGAIACSGTVEFNQTSDGSFSQDISGTGTFVKSGSAVLSLDVDIDQNEVAINDGTLFVSPGVTVTAPSVTIAADGSLQGKGTVGALGGTIVNQGTIIPGASIGTLTIMGDVTFTNGSALEIEFNPTDADLLIVQGMVTIDPGAILHLFPDPVGTYPSSATYTILESEGFTTPEHFTVVTSLPSFTATVNYTATDIEIVIGTVSVHTLITGGNAGQAAVCIGNSSPAPDSDLASVVTALQFMTIAEQTAALNTAQPSILNGLDLCREETLVDVRHAITKWQSEFNRKKCHTDNQYEFWSSGFYTNSTQGNSQGQVGFNTRTYSAISGFERKFIPDSFFGGAFIFTDDTLNWKESGGNSKILSYSGSLYAGWKREALYLQVIGIGGANQYDVKRNVIFPATTVPGFIRGGRA